MKFHVFEINFAAKIHIFEKYGAKKIKNQLFRLLKQLIFMCDWIV